MNRRAFRIETTALELAQTSTIRRALSSSNEFQGELAPLLLAILSSQVRWEVARAIVGELCTAIRDLGSNICSSHIAQITAKHRHPKRALQWTLALLRDDATMARKALSLASSDLPSVSVRRQLIDLVPGLGPKQSSFLIRNLRYEADIAVLDRHLLRYMQMLNLINSITPPSTLAAYEDIEAEFLAYARFRRVSPDALDLAAWLVMRVERTLEIQ
jgi:thermostable 8-oxoguanine DNA glycosylase